MSFDSEFQTRVEGIVERCLPKFLRDRRYSNRNEHEDLGSNMEKEFQKNKLLNQIVTTIQELTERNVIRLQSDVNDKIDQLEKELSVMKEMVIRSWQDLPVRTAVSRSSSILDSDFNSESFIADDKVIKDLNKRIKEVEESTRRKITSNENHLNLLMESIIQLKTSVLQLEQKKPAKEPSVNPQKIQDGVIQVITLKIDDMVEKRFRTVKDIIQDIQNKEKEKQKYYWSIFKDLSDKYDKMRQDTDSLLDLNKKPAEKQGGLSIFRRSSLLPF